MSVSPLARFNLHILVNRASKASASVRFNSTVPNEESNDPSSTVLGIPVPTFRNRDNPLSRTTDLPESSMRRISNMFYDKRITLPKHQYAVFTNLSDEPPLPQVASAKYLYGFSDAEMEGVSDHVKRALHVRTGTLAQHTKFSIKGIVEKFRTTPFDTASSRVVAAVSTVRINRLSAHMKLNPKDKSAKRRLSMIVSRRTKALKHMMKKDYQSYRVSVSELGIRPIPIFRSKFRPTPRLVSHKDINSRNKRINRKRSRGHKGH